MDVDQMDRFLALIEWLLVLVAIGIACDAMNGYLDRRSWRGK
jgi:predicted lysophospholipase L1 biosynthesis ABC-type transport system permease subunit